MSKSNKELAVDLTIAFMQSWNAKTNTQGLQSVSANDVLEQFYMTLSNIETTETNEG